MTSNSRRALSRTPVGVMGLSFIRIRDRANESGQDCQILLKRIVAGSGFDGRGAKIFIVVVGDDHNFGGRIELSYLSRCLQPIHARHANIHQHYIRPMTGVSVKCIGSVPAFKHVACKLKKGASQQAANSVIIFHDQDCHCASWVKKSVPGPNKYEHTRAFR